MAVTVAQIRAGLAASLASLETDMQVLPYMLANPTPPAVHIFPGPIEYDLAMQRGLDKWTLTVEMFVAVASDMGAQVKLDTFLAPAGAQSVKTLLEVDGTLGGIVQDVNVTACSGYRLVATAEKVLLVADWTVEVLASGK